MNPSPSSQTPDLEMLRKAVREYQPDPSRVPFSSLKLVHESIVELRQRNASYRVIAELLQQSGIKTSRARVAEYGRMVLDGGKSRKRRKRTNSVPAVSSPVASQSVPVAATATTPAPAATTASNTPFSKVAFPYTSRGPHIAKVELLKPQEAKEFNDSLKAGLAPKP
jgi:hypothetical protein